MKLVDYFIIIYTGVFFAAIVHNWLVKKAHTLIFHANELPMMTYMRHIIAIYLMPYSYIIFLFMYGCCVYEGRGVSSNFPSTLLQPFNQIPAAVNINCNKKYEINTYLYVLHRVNAAHQRSRKTRCT